MLNEACFSKLWSRRLAHIIIARRAPLFPLVSFLLCGMQQRQPPSEPEHEPECGTISSSSLALHASAGSDCSGSEGRTKERLSVCHPAPPCSCPSLRVGGTPDNAANTGSSESPSWSVSESTEGFCRTTNAEVHSRGRCRNRRCLVPGSACAPTRNGAATTTPLEPSYHVLWLA